MSGMAAFMVNLLGLMPTYVAASSRDNPLGGKDNGKPGVRADYSPNYYAAFAIDPDGFRIEAYCGK